jgi:hypothetical protein
MISLPPSSATRSTDFVISDVILTVNYGKEIAMEEIESCDDYDDGLGRLLTRPPELSVSPASRVIWEQVGGMDVGVRILHFGI